MFAYIKGMLVAATPMQVVVETQGIGYKIFIPPSLFSKLPQIGEEMELHLSFVVREMSHTLYGFDTPQERDLYEALMGASGVGPKLALSIIGHLGVEDVQQAIASGDIRTITKVPGMGKKNSERLIIELRDKMTALFPAGPSNYTVKSQCDPHTQQVNDALSALINLGYTQATAQKAIKKTLEQLPEGIDLGTLITTSLKNV